MGSFNSGIESCTAAVPFIALELGPASLVGSADAPFGLSVLDGRVCLGELDASDGRGVVESLLAGDTGRSPDEEPGGSRSFDFPFPKPLKAAPRFEDDFLSGDNARP